MKTGSKRVYFGLNWKELPIKDRIGGNICREEAVIRAWEEIPYREFEGSNSEFPSELKGGKYQSRSDSAS